MTKAGEEITRTASAERVRNEMLEISMGRHLAESLVWLLN